MFELKNNNISRCWQIYLFLKKTFFLFPNIAPAVFILLLNIYKITFTKITSIKAESKIRISDKESKLRDIFLKNLKNI